MSVDATRWAWLQQIKSSKKLVLLALADRANKDNVCWPSVARIEGDTGLDRKTIMSAIQSMENDGILKVVRVQGVRNKYKLISVDNQKSSDKEEPKKNVKVNKDKEILANFGIDQDLAKDFINYRKNQRAAISKTVIDGFQREADAAGISISDAIRISIERGWRGFKAEWVIKNTQNIANVPTTKGQDIIDNNINASMKFLGDIA